MIKSLPIVIALAVLVAGPAATTVQAAAANSDKVSQATPKVDCSKIKDPQARAACLKKTGK